MNFSTYAGLKNAIASELDRTDLVDQIPAFIELAHVQTERQLRVRQMLASQSITVDAQNESVPADFLEARAFSLSTNPPTKLEFVSIDRAENDGQFYFAKGTPFEFTVVGSQFKFVPAPDAAYTGSLLYYQAIPKLSDAVQTNWLLLKAPDVLFYGALANSAPWLKEDARIATWAQFYQGAVDALTNEDERSQTASNGLKSKARKF